MSSAYPSFDAELRRRALPPVRRAAVTTLQLNIGLVCNLACHHCHVESGPNRKEAMTREGVLRIPTAALLEGNRVLVPNDGRLAERTVEIGLKNWDYAEVRGGLEAGQLVVTSLDRVEVQPGARVVVEPKPQAP